MISVDTDYYLVPHKDHDMSFHKLKTSVKQKNTAKLTMI